MISGTVPPFNFVLALLVWTLWFAFGGGPGLLGLLEQHWPVTVTMVFGSFIAGATSEGGGAVAFPVFTKVLHVAPSDAKVFSLAIQSVGMTAASLVILYKRIKIDWEMLRWASIGGLPGLASSAVLLAPHAPPALTRMIFTVMIASLAFSLFVLNRNERPYHQGLPLSGVRERSILVGAGFAGGVLSGLVGTGIDIVTFSVVVLLFRLSEKVATPTSVILMAGNAIAGFALYGFVLDGFTPQIRDWWLAAVPVVVVGAPLGALACSIMSRLLIARILMGLITVEVLTSLVLVPIDTLTAVVSTAALGCFGSLYYWMYRQSTYEPEAA